MYLYSVYVYIVYIYNLCIYIYVYRCIIIHPNLQWCVFICVHISSCIWHCSGRFGWRMLTSEIWPPNASLRTPFVLHHLGHGCHVSGTGCASWHVVTTTVLGLSGVHSWMVYFMENIVISCHIIYKWMMKMGTPISGTPLYCNMAGKKDL